MIERKEPKNTEIILSTILKWINYRYIYKYCYAICEYILCRKDIYCYFIPRGKVINKW
jgi:hypothetical protein